MIAEYKSKANIGVGVGFLLQALSIVMPRFGDTGELIGTIFAAVGGILFLWGCCMYAKGKGHHSAWDLLAFLSLPGLLVLVLFKDEHK